MKDRNSQDERTISRRRALLGLASAGVGAVAAPTILVGCGGGGGAGTSSGLSTRSAATLTVEWPSSTTRIIPVAANSIAVSFLSGTTTVASQVVTKPTNGTTSTVSFTAVPVGELTLKAEAFGSTDGSGTALASATKGVTIAAGLTATLSISMASTISTLSVTPSTPSVSVGSTVSLAVAAYDASGRIVLTSASKITWESLNPSVASIDGSSGLVTGLATGTATIRMTESESGKTATASLAVGSVATSCHLIPRETDGPYPLYSVLTNSAMIRSSIAETKTGVPLTLELTLVKANSACAVVPNAYVYVWHCDKDGQYSGYSSGQNGNHAGETYCRGILKTDGSGKATFTTIYPGWYAGRITHVHFQVYLSTLAQGTVTATSQLGFPQEITQTVYGSSLYAAHGQNTSVTSFAQDNIFSDGTQYQIATVTGSVSAGYVAKLTVGVNS